MREDRDDRELRDVLDDRELLLDLLELPRPPATASVIIITSVPIPAKPLGKIAALLAFDRPFCSACRGA